MVNFKIVSKILGQLLLIESVMMAGCMIMAFCYHEDDTMAFIISVVVTIGAAFILKYLGRNAENTLGRRDAYLVVTFTWIVFSIFGALPFLISGYVTTPTDAFFETMSGFTTTGASVIDDVERLPHGMLFWRSLTQFIGGLGIVFFTIAVLPSMVGGSVKVFAAEATGPMRAKLHPRLSTTAKWIWTVYIFLTVACALAYWGGGMEWFDSINYSMATTATGGFSTHNNAIGFFNSPTLESIAVLFMFLSGTSFTLLYFSIFKGKPQRLFKDAEFRFYFFMVSGAIIWLTAILIRSNGYGLFHAFRSALFQVVSFTTTTGLYSDDVARWPHLTWIILGVLMFIGGCAGSTSGGYKCLRGLMALKMIRNEFRRILHPKAVLPVKINDQNIHYSSQATLLAFTVLFGVAATAITALMISMNIDHINAIIIAMSCVSNVGPSLSTQIGPDMAWSTLPDGIKWACSLLMLMGRLEIISVVVLFTPSFWKDN